MFIGTILKARMATFGLDIPALAEETFVEQHVIENLVNDMLPLGNMDSFDLDMICSALYCTVEYFNNEEVRQKDMVANSLNRGNDTVKSSLVKARIQNFMDDFIFSQELCN